MRLKRDVPVILNLYNTKNLLSQKPSIAFDTDNPERVKRLRSILHLGGLGLSFLPLPQFVKTLAQDYMESFYKAQMITEGALIGYFESKNDAKYLELLKAQYLNPF